MLLSSESALMCQLTASNPHANISIKAVLLSQVSPSTQDSVGAAVATRDMQLCAHLGQVFKGSGLSKGCTVVSAFWGVVLQLPGRSMGRRCSEYPEG